jgi:hypothetical protein
MRTITVVEYCHECSTLRNNVQMAPLSHVALDAIFMDIILP